MNSVHALTVSYKESVFRIAVVVFSVSSWYAISRHEWESALHSSSHAKCIASLKHNQGNN